MLSACCNNNNYKHFCQNTVLNSTGNRSYWYWVLFENKIINREQKTNSHSGSKEKWIVIKSLLQPISLSYTLHTKNVRLLKEQ